MAAARRAREEEEDPDRWGRPVGVRGEGEGRSGPRETAGPAELGREKEGWAGGRGNWASGKEERKKGRAEILGRKRKFLFFFKLP